MSEEVDNFVDLIHYLEEIAESFVYIDEYKILVIDGSREPIIIMSPDEFMKAQRKALGTE